MTTSNQATDPTLPPFVVREPVDLIALAPVVLGFRPEESVVLETFGGTAGPFHARADLPDAHPDQDALAVQLVAAAVRNEAVQAAVVVFSADLVAARRQGRRLRDALRGAGVSVIDVLCADGSRFHGLNGGTTTGTPYDLDSHRFLARRVFEGEQVHASRADVAASLTGGDEVGRDAVAAAAARVVPTCSSGDEQRAEASWLQGRVRSFCRTRTPLTAADAGRMLALCGVPALREVAWAELTREDGAAHVDLWRDLLRRAPEDLAGPAAGLLAFAAWLNGDGALAWCAIERARAAPGVDHVAETAALALLEAVPPTTWARFRAEILEGDRPIRDGSGSGTLQ